jgi:choline dehydrogenase
MAAWETDGNESDSSSYGSISNKELTDNGSFVRDENNQYHNELSPLRFSAKSNTDVKYGWKWAVIVSITMVFLLATIPIQTGFQILPKKECLYDYIVVGGGPSGILVATKLAHHISSKSGRILLLESGTASQSSVISSLNHETENTLRLNKFDIPLLWSGVASNRQQGRIDPATSHQWPMNTVLLSRALGGGGLINAMIYVRSLPNDFYRWNMSGWNWEEILPHYIDLETYDDSNYEVPPLYQRQNLSNVLKDRGQNGPIMTIPAGQIDAVGPLFIESLLSIGWPLASRGFNIPDRRVGGGFYDFNIRNGVRHSVAEALLGGWNAKEDAPPNLDVLTGATVQRVLFQDRKTIGVEYHKNGLILQAHLRNANSEIILACGAILTPQLLANSGVYEGGTVSDLPGVGKNLQDHPAVGLAFELSSEIAEQANSVYTVASEMEDYFSSVEMLKNMVISERTSVENLKSAFSKMGAFASPGFAAGAFLTSPWANSSIPDIQLTVFPRVEEPHILRKELETGVLPRSSMLVTIALLDPEARYEVAPYQEGLSPDPRRVIIKPEDDNPFTDWFPLPNLVLPRGRSKYLTSHDVRRIAWGVSEVRRILSQPPLSTKIGREVFPGASVLGDALNNHINGNHLPNAHWVGSARMGTDPLAVVDNELRVYGTKGLRVVDASVMPHVPNGNTHSTVCVIASRAADLILSSRPR